MRPLGARILDTLRKHGLTEDEAEQYLHNAYAADGGLHRIEKAGMLDLGADFIWHDSPEGAAYWARIAERMPNKHTGRPCDFPDRMPLED